MGAFFFYKTEIPLNQNAVESLFLAKGFCNPTVHTFGSWTLLHYRKQLQADEPLVVCLAGVKLFAIGTFAYKGLGIQRSLEAVLADHLAGKLERDKLVGAYCFLICERTQITFVTDPMGLIHVFTNDKNTIYSSSFAALLKAGPKKYRVKTLAVIENILTGYIIGPETIVEGVFLADLQYRRTLGGSEVAFVSQPNDGREIEPTRSDSFISCVDKQLAELDRYFSLFEGVVGEAGGVDIGLSGGYDSRLLLLMAQRHFRGVHAHSHFHRSASPDEMCAAKISAALDVPLYRCAEAKQPAEMDSDEFDRNLENVAAYNDGRVFHDYSWLVYFRTRWYREAVLRGLRCGMNGLGGELYRNHDNHCYHRVGVREWIEARVIGAVLASVVVPKVFDNALDYLITKAGLTLRVDISSHITHHQTRRYFGELFCVYGAAVRMNIDSQLALSLSPFLDQGPRLASYGALPHLGLDGRLEAAMIERLSPQLAAITSNYGYPFNRRPPLKRLAKCALRGMLPYRLQNEITSIVGSPDHLYCKGVYERIYRTHLLVRSAVELMQSARFGLKWDLVVRDNLTLERTLSIGIMLLKYEDCIDLSGE